MIILEGPDGAGKSTLCDRLVKEYGFEVGKRGTDNRDLLYTVTVTDTFRALRGALSARPDNPPVIWDRLYFSDLVYAPVQDRDVAFTREERRVIEQTLRELQVPVILCLPPWEVVRKNVLREDRHEMPAVKENIEKIYRQYAHGLPRGGFTFHYDYTKGDQHMFELFAHIDTYRKLRRSRTWSSKTGPR